MHAKTSKFIRIVRRIRIVLHLLTALYVLLVRFPLATSKKSHNLLIQRWCAQLLDILNVKFKATGKIPIDVGQAMMITPNHVSWLDIYLICALYPSRFIAKAEIRSWPLYGWIAYKIGTFFIQRQKRSDAMRINQEITDALKEGDRVAIFPEGTTSNGTLLRPFHASLLQAAVNTQSIVQPVGIRYLQPSGELNLNVAFIDDMSFGASINKVLEQPIIYAELVFGESIDSQGKTRRELAHDAQEIIASALGLTLDDKKFAITADHPA